MQSVRKTFFDPLATTKAQIRQILAELPVGSAHPFSPERILLCRTDRGIDEIDISSYPEDFFFNAVDLGEMGEALLRRMAGFTFDLNPLKDFEIQQAPSSTFKVPIVSGQITILAVSERRPTYWDLCFANASYTASDWSALRTLPGITHSGDKMNGSDLLHHAIINTDSFPEEEMCVFISGYNSTQITRFLGTHPAMLVANHADKVLYIVPVPLDAATIGDAVICCPLVIKRDGDSLVCSILANATTDRKAMSRGQPSPAIPEAIQRSEFTILQPTAATQEPKNLPVKEDTSLTSESFRQIVSKENVVIATNSVTLPSLFSLESTQIIRFGTGIAFELENEQPHSETQQSAVVLPCIYGSQLQGPVLLATGTTPSNVPFLDELALRNYYEQLNNIVVIVDDRMTDNARNLATSYRLNALFILQLNPENEPKSTEDILGMMNSANINAVTALAGPQSLVLVQIFDKYYFYRGLANRAHLNTSGLAFGSDVTCLLGSLRTTKSLIDPRVTRIVDLDAHSNTIILPSSGKFVRPQDLQRVFEELPVEELHSLEEDIAAAVLQLQSLLNQKDLQELSKVLISALSAKINNMTAPLRDTYITFLAQEYKVEDAESVKRKSFLLGKLRKTTKELQRSLEPLISSLANMMSSQTTSKRTHDMKRLLRQAQIQGNVEAAKSMTYDTLAGYLETYAADMGVMLLNIETMPYRQLLGNLKNVAIDASGCCELDSRVLYLEGFDAGIIIEQSQSTHNGPLRSQTGDSSQPILAVPYLNQGKGYDRSMLAWVCWDEFVNLKSPYTVRWMEKCNEAHIAALRILMRSTLSQAVASREHNLQPGSGETGQLMSALLMAAMSKLAAMRTTPPMVVSDQVEDTVTRLMRGLFGNFLTIAGSGVRPLSMVWQLFGLNPQYDIPTKYIDWIWYETAVSLYPYTGWPLEQFLDNLEKLLDKAIIRVVTKNEDKAEIKKSRTDEMIRYCKLRNIQLAHCRTIITIFMRMLTAENINVAAVAARLLEQLPRKLEKQTQSYTKMINYLEHLANGGQQRVNDNIIAACVYTKRSAAFSELKTKVSEACVSQEWVQVKQSCQALIDKHTEAAALWRVPPGSLHIQNMKVYRDVSDTDDNIGQEDTLKLTRQILSDAEKNRVPWQVGKASQFGDNIEPLDEAFLHEVLTGEKLGSIATTDPDITMTTSIIEKSIDEEFSEFGKSVQPKFISTMQRDLSAEDVCAIIKVPVSAMRVFIKALKPEFVWEDLARNFKPVILGLLRERSNRPESRPMKKLLALVVENKSLQIKGQKSI
ncbi:hypothetical protein ZTR_02561 [Talaromyces verruculosus]|nr:hypothetical protein ZTR_02561 [Talaromyces verruculosus]